MIYKSLCGREGVRLNQVLRSCLMAGAGPIWLLASAALAQTPPPPPVPAPAPGNQDVSTLDEVVVTGIRATIQSSIETKRESATIVDALTADEIGNLPAASVGEAIETITGAASQRGKGIATEISIRGLGPFLSITTFNGREASNGSGDRSVNFSQFPSELIDQIKIYKTQQADLVEGGVAGLIELGTVRPLDSRRRLISFEAKANYNEYDDNHLDPYGLGFRGTASYVDQFDIDGFGRFGVSLGYQANRTTNPEDTFSASSTWVACNDSVTVLNGNCPEVTRAQGNAGVPFYLISNSLIFRQIEEQDSRDAYFGAFQWRPTDRLELNLDFQYSDRQYDEDRHDLIFSSLRVGVSNRVVEDHVLRSFNAISSIDSQGTFFHRSEIYQGGGVNAKFQVTDALSVTADISYSNTIRDDVYRIVRLRSDDLDIFGVRTAIANSRVPIAVDYRAGDVPSVTVDPRFDLNDYRLFSDDAILRRDNDRRDDTATAARIDARYELSQGFLTRIDAGIRYSERDFDDYQDSVIVAQNDRAVDRRVNEACRMPFPQNDFLGAASGNIINSWATFDTLCQYREYLGVEDPGGSADLRDPINRDVVEKVWAGYAMASFEGQVGAYPLTGNFGVRVVDTSLTSVGLRAAIDVITNSDGTIRLDATDDFSEVVIEAGTTRWLPSLNTTLRLRDDLFLRGGIFRALSRPAPSALGAGRLFTLESETISYTTIDEAVREVRANGSPRLEPLMSWNYDLSLEYYPNPDALFAFAVYAKQFTGGVEPVATNETFLIGGQPFTVPVSQTQNSDDNTLLTGFEASLAYRFSNLPEPFDGLGTKLSYSYADADGENEDIRLGDLVDATTGAVEQGIIEPANVNGLSNHVASAQLYYEYGGLNMQAIYKYRSEHFQDFLGGNSQLRYYGSSATVDFRASYDLTRNIRLSFEGTNLTDSPRMDNMPVLGSLRSYTTFGPKFFAGVRYRF